MALLNDDQKMIQETARNFLADEGSITEQLRHWRDKGCSDGFGHGLWKQFAELGLTGICVPESAGGAGAAGVEGAGQWQPSSIDFADNGIRVHFHIVESQPSRP